MGWASGFPEIAETSSAYAFEMTCRMIAPFVQSQLTIITASFLELIDSSL